MYTVARQLRGLRRPMHLAIAGVAGLVAGGGGVGLSDLVGLDMGPAGASPISPGSENCPCPTNVLAKNGVTAGQVQQVQAVLQAVRDAKMQRVVAHQQRLALASAMPQTGIGFDSANDAELTNGLIPVGGTVTLSSQTVTPFRATRLVVPRTQAPFFSLSALKMAKVEWISSDQSVPASMFTEDAISPPMEQAVLSAGVPAIISVENVSSAPQRFTAGIWGLDLNPNSALA